MLMKHLLPVGFASLVLLHLAPGCGSDDNTADEHTGQSCSMPTDCYPAVARATLQGEVVCMDRVLGGYCTHRCTVDADCCAVKDECKTGFPQVCSPFESTGEKYCFLSCEADLVENSDAADDTAYCQKYASSQFNCRSSGGGSENRKVCVP